MSCFDVMEGWGGSKKATFASKNKTEGFCWGQKPSISRFDAMGGGVGLKSPPSRRKRDGGLLLGTEALHVAFRHDGGVGWVEKPTVVLKHDREGFYWA